MIGQRFDSFAVRGGRLHYKQSARGRYKLDPLGGAVRARLGVAHKTRCIDVSRDPLPNARYALEKVQISSLQNICHSMRVGIEEIETQESGVGGRRLVESLGAGSVIRNFIVEQVIAVFRSPRYDKCVRGADNPLGDHNFRGIAVVRKQIE